MATANPYLPPRAAVADVHSDAVEFQDINLWSIKGRIGRVRYLAYIVAGYLLFAVLGGIVGAIGAATRSTTLVSVLLVVGGIAYAIWTIMMLIQRTHDMGWSGWAALLTIIPFVALIWFFKAGTPGVNDYGAPPPPNTRAVKILAWIFPAIFLVGIVAAIALPAYQQYTVRAKAAKMQTQP